MHYLSGFSLNLYFPHRKLLVSMTSSYWGLKTGKRGWGSRKPRKMTEESLLLRLELKRVLEFCLLLLAFHHFVSNSRPWKSPVKSTNNLAKFFCFNFIIYYAPMIQIVKYCWTWFLLIWWLKVSIEQIFNSLKHEHRIDFI